jgi:hypothetical protein
MLGGFTAAFPLLVTVTLDRIVVRRYQGNCVDASPGLGLFILLDDVLLLIASYLLLVPVILAVAVRRSRRWVQIVSVLAAVVCLAVPYLMDALQYLGTPTCQ